MPRQTAGHKEIFPRGRWKSVTANRGIISRMDKHNPDDTAPTPAQPNEPDLEKTQATPIRLDETRPTPLPVDPDIESTQTMRVSRQELEATQATPVQPGPVSPNFPPPHIPADSPNEPEAPRKRSFRWLLWALVGVVLLATIAGTSAYGGYLSALEMRRSNQATQVFSEAQQQFDLGMQDLLAKRYDLARQRFEYVIQLNPNFPGVTEALAQVLLALNTTATPTIAPTPTLTPTPDMRGQEDLYLQARQHLLNRNWTAAIDTLLTLRKRFPDYLTVEVDGLLFVALRNRGVEKISLQAELEGGTYDLSLAEGFGPLDVEARNWRDWATLYVRGASFWDVDWQQAVFYFSQLAQIAPNLTDATGLTAIERYRQALIKYGDWLALQERWCEALEQYELGLGFRSDPAVQPTAAFVYDRCYAPPPENTGGEVTPTPTLSPTPGGEATPTPAAPPAETPTPTQEPPPPTETPTPTPG